MSTKSLVIGMAMAMAMVAVACSSSAGPGGDGDGDGKACSLVGCNSSVKASLSTTLSEGELATTKVIACRNDACSEGTIGLASGTINGSRFYACTFASATGLQGPSCEGTSIGALVFTFGLEDGVAKDGDRYSFKVVAKDGTVKGEKTGAATYKTSTPNGPECGPVCSQAEL